MSANPNPPTFKFSLQVPLRVRFSTSAASRALQLDRGEFFEWIWNELGSQGLLGIHEGTLLSEEAVEAGLETESWTVDSGEAPRERDWVGNSQDGHADLYFDSEQNAENARTFFASIVGLQVGSVEKQAPQDWDAQWKASFSGAEIPPFWKVIPQWESLDSVPLNKKAIRINPGAGFGTGTHETTQLCLQAIGEISQENSFSNKRVLDFGSGSGILAIGLALLGAKVDAVEIDPLARDNAVENAELNQVQTQIRHMEKLESISENGEPPYDIVVANILRPVLLEFAEALVKRLKSQGTNSPRAVILSGLIESDVEPVIQKYSLLLSTPPIRVYEKGEWRAIVF